MTRAEKNQPSRARLESRIRRCSGTKVVTVTLNPTLDKTLRVPRLVSGETLIALESEIHAGGKGTNVSKALSAMGVVSTATGILGRYGSGSFTALLERDGIDHDFLLCDGRIRTNVTLIDGEGGQETHIRERGGPVSEESLDRFEEKLLSRIDPSTLCVLAGSLPQGLEPDTYVRLLNGIAARGGAGILDSSGDPLRAVLFDVEPGRDGVDTGVPSSTRRAPWGVKPNEAEVRESLGLPLDRGRDYLFACGKLHDLGVSLVVISRGKKGLLASMGGRAVHAGARLAGVVNTVGSGDAVVAAMVIARSCRFTLEETARLACAMGSANALVSGGGKIVPDDVWRLYDLVKIEPAAGDHLPDDFC